MNKFYKIVYCKDCNKQIVYTRYNNYKNFIDGIQLCKECKRKHKEHSMNLKRNCPSCGKEIKYLNLRMFKKAVLNKTICKKCFLGSPELIAKRTKYGEDHYLYNKSMYTYWTEKYGKDVADEKLNKFKDKCRLNSIGNKNNMYNRLPSDDSGSGWSGTYYGFKFRSLLELSYMIYLRSNNILFIPCELDNRFSVNYMFNNSQRNYYPDFYLLSTNNVVEIKPKHFLNIKNNMTKIKAAEDKFGDNFFVVTDNELCRLSYNKIYEMYNNNEITLSKKYENRLIGKFNHV